MEKMKDCMKNCVHPAKFFGSYKLVLATSEARLNFCNSNSVALSSHSR